MPTFSYRNTPVSFKLAVTAFLLLAVLGLGVAGLQIYVRAGLTPQSTLAHFRGNEETMQYPLSFGAMVEITHAHAFAQPMLALVLALAILASGAREWLKRAVVVVLFTGMAMELGVPWLVRYGPAWTVHLLLLTGALIISGVLVAAAIPLYEMWWRPETAGTTAARPDEWRRAG
jgi:hypothetical protein